MMCLITLPKLPLEVDHSLEKILDCKCDAYNFIETNLLIEVSA